MKTSPIYLDRLEKVLSAHGVSLKRHQLLEAVAAAFGYHNSNEFSAAAKRGALTPPAVTPIGTVALPDGQNLIIVTDTLANSAYGIDEAFIEQVVEEERAETIGITPYGHLAFLGDLAGQPIRRLNTAVDATELAATIHEISCIDADDLPLALNALAEIRSLTSKTGVASVAPVVAINDAPEGGKALTVYVAWIEHKHGTNTYTAFSAADLERQIADFCTEWWGDIAGSFDAEMGKVPDNPDGLSVDERIQIYFGAVQDEYVNRDTHQMKIGPDLAAALELALPKPPAPLQVGPVELPSAEWLIDVASVLNKGATEDIWFDAHAYPGEEAAASTIEETQRAMTEASRILTALASASAVTPTGVSNDLCREVRRDDEHPIWITDNEGDDTFQVNQRMLDSLGLAYQMEKGQYFLPLTDAEYAVVRHQKTSSSKYDCGYPLRLGFAVLYKGKKWHAPEIDIEFDDSEQGAREVEAIRQAIEPSIKALGGHVYIALDATDSSHEISFLLPFGIAELAHNIENYFAALDYLINGQREAEAKQVIATFRPQTWVNDYAFDADAEGETKFDVTFDLLLMGQKNAADLENDDDVRDQLRYAHKAESWIHDWSGPFEVDVDQWDIDQLFNIAR